MRGLASFHWPSIQTPQDKGQSPHPQVLHHISMNIDCFFFFSSWSRKNIAEMVMGLNWRTHLIFFIFVRGQKCLELLMLQKGKPCYLCWFPTRQVRLLAWLSFRLFLYHCLLHFIISRYVKQTKPCRFYCTLYLSSKQPFRFI